MVEGGVDRVSFFLYTLGLTAALCLGEALRFAL